MDNHILHVIENKCSLILAQMLTIGKLSNLYKCAGRFCSYTTNNAHLARLHEVRHKELGGADALMCPYCNLFVNTEGSSVMNHMYRCHGNSTYCCSQCFYRAVHVRLVESHLRRVHGVESAPELSIFYVPLQHTEVDTSIIMLTAEEAVKFYQCTHITATNFCQYRTYYSEQFHHHLITKHCSTVMHRCNECNQLLSRDVLISHMKNHHYNYYCCNWCVFGADNCDGLIAHFSSEHPNKWPQAYIRTLSPIPLPLFNIGMSAQAVNVYSQRVVVEDNPIVIAECAVALENIIRSQQRLVYNVDDDEPDVALNANADEQPIVLMENENQN